MISKRKIKTIAKKMLSESKVNEFLNSKKVNDVLTKIVSSNPAGLSVILKIYRRMVKQSLSKEEVIVEIPKDYKINKKFENELLNKTGALRVNYKINPNITFGLRIKYSDWIYDSSLNSKLNTIANI